MTMQTVASHGFQGEGESSLLVLWVASETGREGGKSLACLSIQANQTAYVPHLSVNFKIYH